MDELSIIDQSKVTLLASQQVAEFCLSHITNPKKGNKSLSVDLRDTLEREVLGFGVSRYRLDDIENAIKIFYPHNPTVSSLPYNLGFLEEWSDDFLEYQHNGYCLKERKITQYFQIIRHINPDFLFAALYNRALNSGDLTLNAIYQLAQSQPALGLPLNPNKTAVDFHVHAGGVLDLGNMLMRAAASPWISTPNKKDFARVEKNRYSGLKLRELEDLAKTLHHLCAFIIDIVCQKDFKEALAIFTSCQKTGRIGRQKSFWSKLRAIKHSTHQDENTQLLQYVRQLRLNDNNSAAFRLLSLIAYRLCDPQKDHYWVGLCFIHISNLLRSAFIMEGVGFENFVDYFAINEQALVTDKDWLKESVKALSPSNAPIYQELKFGRYCEKTFNLFHQEFNKQKKGKTDSKLHFSIALSRSFDKKKATLKENTNSISVKQSKSVLNAQKIRKGLSKTRVRLPLSLKKSDKKSASSENIFVRSFDVQGNENEFQIETFAPALRLLRNKPILQHYRNQDIPAPQRKLAVHAGEDFSLLPTGLRRIDETVEFCGMQNGDRLGHAIALGIDPQKWAKRQEISIAALQEHLDNLVWLWSIVTLLPSHIMECANWELRLRGKIEYFAPLLFGANTHHYSPHDLHSAWKLRRNNRKESVNIKDRKYLRPDFINKPALDDKDREGIIKLWKIYCTEHARMKLSPQKNAKNVTVYWNKDNSPNGLNDYWNANDILMLEAIQDFLLTRYDEEGLILEACPSSNVFITRVRDYCEHPILRWRAPNGALKTHFNKFGLRKGQVKICINTDDPKIFPTTIWGEYEIMKVAAQSVYGISALESEKWLEDIRVLSEELFKAESFLAT